LSHDNKIMSENNISTESERRIATVMFADISGFTAMSEKMDLQWDLDELEKLKIQIAA
jgi:class 3 adenylate cyclase